MGNAERVEWGVGIFYNVGVRDGPEGWHVCMMTHGLDGWHFVVLCVCCCFCFLLRCSPHPRLAFFNRLLYGVLASPVYSAAVSIFYCLFCSILCIDNSNCVCVIIFCTVFPPEVFVSRALIASSVGASTNFMQF